MTGKLLKPFDTKTLKAEPGERSVVATISTAIVDHDGDVLLPSGMDKTIFKSNPQMLLYHKSDELPLGSWSDLVKNPEVDGITGKGTFIERDPLHPPTAAWLPDTIFWYFQKKVLRAFSVGFIIDDASEPTVKESRMFEGARRMIRRWKLLEISVVNTPANRLALATAVSKGLVTRSDGDLADLWEIPTKTELVIDSLRKECLTIIDPRRPLIVTAA